MTKFDRDVFGRMACTRCSRPSMQWSQLCRLCYDERAKEVYWDCGPACRAKGPDRAECLLSDGHFGDHEGNGFDTWGPLGRTWSNARDARGDGDVP